MEMSAYVSLFLAGALVFIGERTYFYVQVNRGPFKEFAHYLGADRSIARASHELRLRGKKLTGPQMVKLLSEAGFLCVSTSAEALSSWERSQLKVRFDQSVAEKVTCKYRFSFLDSTWLVYMYLTPSNGILFLHSGQSDPLS